MTDELDSLDRIAVHLREGSNGPLGLLSSGELVYVALAANRADLLASNGYSLVEAWARLGETWRAELLARWQYGRPAHTR